MVPRVPATSIVRRPSSSEDRQRTPVRAVLSQQLKLALDGLNLQQSIDSDPFCARARRSVALCNFKRRPGEDAGKLRERMLQIIQTVNAGKVNLEGASKPLRCSSRRRRSGGARLLLLPSGRSSSGLLPAALWTWTWNTRLGGLGSRRTSLAVCKTNPIRSGTVKW